MTNELVFIFSPEKMQELINQNPDKIIVRSSIEAGRLDSGENVGYIKVSADALQGGHVVGTIDGCPKPPCE